MGEGKDEEIVKIEFKAYMHCSKCGKQVEKYITKIEGVHKVEADVEKSRLTVVGKVDSDEIQKKLEKKIKKLQLLSLSKEKTNVEEKKIVLNLQIHCEQCEENLKEEIMKLKDVYKVKTDFKAQTCTIEGILDQEEILEFLHKKFKKHAEVTEVIAKKMEKKKEDVEKKDDAEKKKEDAEKNKEEEKNKKEEEKNKKEEEKNKKEEEKNKKEEEKKLEIKAEKKEVTVEKKIEIKAEEKAPAPYIVHYVYAPQIFSDENPEACHVM
ncbi:unnamed protein product [Victoria cruziana]